MLEGIELNGLVLIVSYPVLVHERFEVCSTSPLFGDAGLMFPARQSLQGTTGVQQLLTIALQFDSRRIFQVFCARRKKLI